jgi:hypothetical protein
LIIVGVVLVVVGGAAVWLVLRLNNGPVSQKILVPVLKPDPFKPNQAFAEPPVVPSRGGLLQAKTGTVGVAACGSATRRRTRPREPARPHAASSGRRCGCNPATAST